MRGLRLFIPGVMAGMLWLLSCGGAGGGSSPDSQFPSVSFINLQNEQVVQGTVYLTLSAQDNQKVVKVEIYVDGILNGVLPSGSSDYIWNTQQVANGFHILKARAYDSAGNAGEASIRVVVANAGAPDTSPPSVQFSSPANLQTVRGNVPLRAFAFDDNRVMYVDFWIDSAFVFRDSTSPYEYLWQSESYANGEHTLKAKAYDSAGNTGEASLRVMTANPEPDTTPPSFEGLESAEAVDETSIRLSWQSATDDRTSSSWMVYLICGSTKAGKCVNSFRVDYITEPGALSFTVPSLLPGTPYYFVVRARDSAGNAEDNRVEKSATTRKDILPPQVRITYPPNGSTVSRTVSILTEVSDNSFCIQQVEFLVDSVSVYITYLPPYLYPWNTDFEEEGNHTLSAYAEDCSGNTGIDTIVVIVQHPATTGPPEAVTLVANEITQTSARLNGGVKPNGLATTAYFEWGVSPSYGNTTPPEEMGNGRDFVSLYAGITGLAPNTLYHYRVVASNLKGTTYGEDATFITGVSPPPETMKKIAFYKGSSDRNAVGLYVINEDGSGVKQIAPSTRSGSQIPVWSPDGKKIAYTDSLNFGDRGEPSKDLLVVNEDGTGWKNLTNTYREQGYFSNLVWSWSPDSSKILSTFFVDSKELEDGRIYAIDADGTSRKCLTCGIETEIWDFFPSYSHSGNQIAFSHDGDLWVMDADGSNPKELYRSTCRKTRLFVDCVQLPQFTKDDTRILFFIRNIIYSIPVEGGEPLKVATVDFGSPYCHINDMKLSPDGEKIAFTPSCYCPIGLYVMNVDGSQLRNIASHPSNPSIPLLLTFSWSPDSQRIVHDLDFLTIVDIDGNSPPRILNVLGESPAWQP